MNTVKSWVRRMSATLRWGGSMALALAVGELAPARAAEVVVGQVAPLSGVLASTGAQMVLGGKIYFDWVNAHGGVHGASIRQSVADDGYKVADTVTRTRELLAKPEVVALYGFAGTANITQLLAESGAYVAQDQPLLVLAAAEGVQADARAQQIASQRLAAAGYRLGYLLDAICVSRETRRLQPAC